MGTDSLPGSSPRLAMHFGHFVSTFATITGLETLASQCGRTWPMITKANADAIAVRQELRDQVSAASLTPADTSLVVFGSLARGEWTQKSDLDWALMVDGEVDGGHADVARQIAELFVRLGYHKPGPTGVFGGLVFSHDIVHVIGGEEDSNANTTRRILLLLESTSLGEDKVRSRVIKALLRCKPIASRCCRASLRISPTS